MIKNQTRHLHRILTRNKNRIVASIKPTTRDGEFVQIPTGTPITSAVPESAFDLTNPSPKLSKKTTYQLSNVAYRPPVFPMSDGSNPTPVLEWQIYKTRRIGLVGMKMGMTTMWDMWGRQRAVTVIKVCLFLKSR